MIHDNVSKINNRLGYKNFLSKDRIGQVNICPQLPHLSFLPHRAAVLLPFSLSCSVGIFHS